MQVSCCEHFVVEVSQTDTDYFVANSFSQQCVTCWLQQSYKQMLYRIQVSQTNADCIVTQKLLMKLFKRNYVKFPSSKELPCYVTLNGFAALCYASHGLCHRTVCRRWRACTVAKRCEIDTSLLWNTNRNSYMEVQNMSWPLTSDVLEWVKSRSKSKLNRKLIQSASGWSWHMGAYEKKCSA